MSARAKLTQACSICHKKKIKCDLDAEQPPCTNCRIADLPCRPHKRKRKRYNLSPSPPPEYHTSSRNSYPPRPYHNVSPHGAPVPALLEGNNTTHSPLHTVETQRESSEHVDQLHHQHHQDVAIQHDIQPVESTPAEHVQERGTPPLAESYVGRDAYLDGSIPVIPDKVVEDVDTTQANHGLSEIDLQVLRLYKAFDLPPRSIRTSLIDNFLEHCLPWMPIVDKRWLHDQPDHVQSILLLQAVFLAGSRVSSRAWVGATSGDYYQRAKSLFFAGHEKNPIIALISVLLLHWWNPTGPEQISASTSAFWVRIAAGLAYQIGLHKEPAANAPGRLLRRRLWWTLVLRDNVISVGVGRPRTINIKDSNVLPPTINDFPLKNTDARIFIAYCGICELLAEITEFRRRKRFLPEDRRNFENALYRWIKELPSELRIFSRDRNKSLNPYNFKTRQLAVVYFVAVLVLHRTEGPSASSSTPSLVASSFIAGMFEDFLSRDELRYLGPVFAFYALAAGISQLSGYRYPGLESAADAEYQILSLSLQSLSDRWGSASEAMRSLTAARKTVAKQPRLSTPPAPVPAEVMPFFIEFGPELCRQWHLLGIPLVATHFAEDRVSASNRTPRENGNVESAAPNNYVIGQENRTNESIVGSDFMTMPQTNLLFDQQDPMLYPNMGEIFPDQQYGYPWSDLDPVGTWLLGDLGLEGSMSHPS